VTTVAMTEKTNNRLRLSSFLLATAFAFAPASAALAGSDQSAPVVLFGKLPLGGKMKQPKTCPDLADAKDVCWVSAPRPLKGDRIGSVLLPDAASPLGLPSPTSSCSSGETNWDGWT